MKKLVVLMILALCATVAFADSVTGDLVVTAKLLPTVTVVANSLDFGDWFIDTAAPIAASTTIDVTASLDLPFVISLGGGGQPDAAYRYLVNADDPSATVAYSLFKEDGLEQWGDFEHNDTFPAGTVVAGTGTAALESFVLNGVLYPSLVSSTAIPTGKYNDTVLVTVWY